MKKELIKKTENEILKMIRRDIDTNQYDLAISHVEFLKNLRKTENILKAKK